MRIGSGRWRTLDSPTRRDRSPARCWSRRSAPTSRAPSPSTRDRPALISRHQGIRLSYAELDAEVDRIARALIAAGLERGDRLGLWSPNRVEWALIQYATARLGVILVNVNPAYRSHELAYAVRQSGCRMLVAAKEFKSSDYVAMVGEVRDQLEDLERVVHLDDPSWDELVASAGEVDEAEVAARSAALDPGDPINIQYTSGTTGFPKGATLSHVNILNNGFFVGEGCRITEADSICVPVPYYHCFGMVMGNLAAISHGRVRRAPGRGLRAGLGARRGQRRALHDALRGADDVHRRAHRARPRPRPLGPELAADRDHGRLALPGRDHAGRDRTHEHGRGDDLLRDDRDLAGLGADRFRRRARAPGLDRRHRAPHVEVRVAEPDTGEVLPRGETGEFQTRGYSVMLGYWEDPERTSEAIDAEGWMHTGDQATMDDDGYLKIVGRIKDMVIRGGENVYPREVEEFLLGHPEVLDVQVVGVPDERFGEELCAWVRCREGAGSSPRTCASTAAGGSPTTRCRATCALSTSSR